MMRKLIILSVAVATSLVACKSTTKKTTETKVVAKTEQAACCSANKTASCCDKKESAVKAYYFHNTRRCVTCKTVESVATEALLTKNITLQSVNLEEAEGKALAKKLEVSGQTLLIVAGDKKENLTNFAFLNARSNPDLLKSKINATVDALNK